MLRRAAAAILVLMSAPAALVPAASAAEPLRLYAAGSLKAALGQVARAYAKAYGQPVAATFAPSGLLRQRIEKGEPAQVFASANMKHPEALARQGKGGPVVLFARNRLCALVQPGLRVTSATLLDRLLDPGVRVGTSTPKADPSGDYAWRLFARAEALKSGAQKALEAKALQLTGGPASAKPPAGRNPYGWVMAEKKADIFLTYCTNAVLARKEVPALQIVDIPEALAVGADYGLIVLDSGNAAAWRLAAYILSPAGQRVLGRFGFDVRGVPAK